MDKTKFEKLKAAAAVILSFGAAKPTTHEAGKFEAFKIKDGETMVEFNPTLEKGSLVFVSSGTGSSPAADSEYEFDSGIKFKTEGGKISEVISDGKEDDDKLTDEEKKAKKAKEDMSAQVAELFELQAAAFRTEIDGLKTELAGYKELFAKIPTKDALEDFTTQLKDVGQAIEAFEIIPVETPVDQPNPEAAKKLAYEKMASAFMGDQAEK